MTHDEDEAETIPDIRSVPDDLYADEQPARLVVHRSRFVVNLTSSIKGDLRKLRAAHEKTKELWISIGDKLIRLKTEIKHGEWLPWLETNFDLSEDSAELYMDIARNSERVRNMPVEVGLKAAVVILRAERKATRAKLEGGRDFTPEQLERRTEQQVRNATRRLYEKIGELAGSEEADLSLEPEQLWPDSQEREQRIEAIRVAYDITQHVVASDEQSWQDDETDAIDDPGIIGITARIDGWTETLKRMKAALENNRPLVKETSIDGRVALRVSLRNLATAATDTARLLLRDST